MYVFEYLIIITVLVQFIISTTYAVILFTDLVVRALEQLYALGAIGADGGRLTDLGRQMAEFPLDPTFAKVLIQSQVRPPFFFLLFTVSFNKSDLNPGTAPWMHRRSCRRRLPPLCRHCLLHAT